MGENKLIIKDHNLEAYDRVRRRFEKSKRTCVINATGTGKAYIALQCIRDYHGKKIYITSYMANLKEFQEKANVYLGETNTDFLIYAGVKNYLPKLRKMEPKPELIILDEFHRAGAKKWGENLKKMLAACPNAKVLGLTATEKRYLDNERDMANELFNSDIAYRLPLDEALMRGILPEPQYSVCIYYDDEVEKMERLIQEGKVADIEKSKKILMAAKKYLEHTKGIADYFDEMMQNKNGKYIVFCQDYKHLQRMKEESRNWFHHREVHYYEMYSDDDMAYENMKQFEKDNSNLLRLLFVISMLNEGVHIDGVDGCILLRTTKSANVYFQQIGRALSTNRHESPLILDVVNNAENLNQANHFWTDVRKKAGKKAKRKTGRQPEFHVSVFGENKDLALLIEEFYRLKQDDDNWSEEELNILKKEFPKIGRAVFFYLEKKTPFECYKKAKELGLPTGYATLSFR